MEKEGISARLQNTESAARWLGKQFDATVVVVAQAKLIKQDVVKLSARFLNVRDSNLVGPSSEVNQQVAATTEEVGYSRIIMAEGAVGSDGRVRAVRIVNGAPFGLNEAVVHTVSTWRCKPAMLDGKSVATVVPFEVHVRLFASN